MVIASPANIDTSDPIKMPNNAANGLTQELLGQKPIQTNQLSDNADTRLHLPRTDYHP
jgi:hypothetical protein